jgi:anti-sigma28 factor (negative regulator of flagellin synthesis)
MKPTPPEADPPSLPEKIGLSFQHETKAASVPSSGPTPDVASLTIASEEVSQFLKQMPQIPDLRQARITQIQEALESSSYISSAEKLADKLLQELRSLP